MSVVRFENAIAELGDDGKAMRLDIYPSISQAKRANREVEGGGRSVKKKPQLAEGCVIDRNCVRMKEIKAKGGKTNIVVATGRPKKQKE